ncbi:MAG: glycosyltransferase, partial [Anaerolineae bacterium]|nr:glycosyltransferase [Anaerolineae bacterium]
LVAQKGYDLALPALWQMLGYADVQFILLGAGDPALDREFGWLALAHPQKARVFQGYNAALAQRIYAGCDVFLMPSHFEPCGIGQMVAMRYGALPLVRETGGLADTVQNYDNGNADQGVGFVFNWETPEALLGTLYWALGTYHNKRDAWQRMQRRAMQTDFSWAISAQKYVDLYSSAITNRRRMFTS